MQRLLAPLCLVLTLGGPPAYADTAPDAAGKDQPKEESSVTHHSLALSGKTLKYTATAGTLLIRDDKTDDPTASVFFVAYTLDGADPTHRPVTFLYNGGPGSASIWLHMGSVGPKRVL